MKNHQTYRNSHNLKFKH